MRSKFLSIILCIALLLSFVPPTNVAAQEAGESLHVGLIYPINQLDPMSVETSSEAVIAEQLFLGLVRLDEGGNPIPELATEWNISDDGLTWTFYLRQGIPWMNSDRKPVRDVVAGDVVTTMDRAREFGSFNEVIQSVETVDDYTVQFSLRAPTPDFLRVLAVSPVAKILPADLLDAYGWSPEWAQPGVMYFSGSYLLIDRTRSIVRLEPNPYWVEQEGFAINSVLVEYTPRYEDALQRYLNEEFDLIELPPEIAETLTSEPGLGEQVRFPDAAGIDLFSQLPLARIPGIGHSYLVKPHLLPVFSPFFGLARFFQWGFNTQPPDVQIAGVTRVLNDDTLRALVSISGDQSVLTFRQVTPQLNLIFPGNIIVGRSTLDVGTQVAPYGFLRRVVNAFSDGSGQFVVETEPAALDEAVRDGGTPTPVSFGLGDVYQEEVLTVSDLPSNGDTVPVGYVPPYAGLKVQVDHVLYDDDGDANTKNDQVRAQGWVNVEPGAEVRLDFDIRNHHLQSFRFVAISHESAELKLYSQLDVLKVNKVVPIKQYIFMPATFLIGPVPVVVTPQLTVYVGADARVSVEFSAGVEQSAEITTGASYGNGNWSPIIGISDNHIDKTLTPKLEPTAKAEAFAGPELSVKVYGVAGPYGQVKGYLALKADPTASPWWTLKGGVNGELGMKVEIFSFAVATYTVPITILAPVLLDQAGGGIAPPTDIPPQPTPTIIATKTPTKTSSCNSIWWPPGCWTWWIWVIAVIVVLVILVILF